MSICALVLEECLEPSLLVDKIRLLAKHHGITIECDTNLICIFLVNQCRRLDEFSCSCACIDSRAHVSIFIRQK
ncbi:hypothetical protein U713_16670 [Rhodobacter capsulatus YW2]|nr:hypothetical protein U713_16670 [Rhodobacter capsulatus YW2]